MSHRPVYLSICFNSWIKFRLLRLSQNLPRRYLPFKFRLFHTGLYISQYVLTYESISGCYGYWEDSKTRSIWMFGAYNFLHGLFTSIVNMAVMSKCWPEIYSATKLMYLQSYLLGEFGMFNQILIFTCCFKDQGY